MEYRYNALVLSKKEVGETDRLYTLYTREQGKIRVMAKGVRKPEAKLAGQLENFTLVQIIINKTRGTGRVASAVADDVFASLRSDYETLLSVSQSVSILEKFVDMEEPDEALFLLLKTYLTEVDQLVATKKENQVRLLSQVFLLQLFSHLGYHIETAVCVQSGERLKPGERHFFSPKAGGILNEEESRNFPGSFFVAENTIKLMRLFSHNSLSSCMKVQMQLEDLRELEMVTRRFADWIAH